MTVRLKHLLNRLAGHAPHTVQPFAQLVSPARGPDDTAAVKGFSGVLATAPADTCDYPSTHSLLRQLPVLETPPNDSCHRPIGGPQTPPRQLFSMTDAGIAGGDGVVYCPRRRVAVAETVRVWLQPASTHPLLSAPGFPAAQPLRGITLSLASLGAEGFYHFLIESLPRVELARPWLAQVDQVLAPGRPGSFQEKWLSLAGIPHEKIIWLDGHSHFRCEQLLFTSPLSYDSEPTPWLVNAICETVDEPLPPPGSRHLWISRRDAGVRHLAWEDVLLAQLPTFERVELAGRAPADQIDLMREATVIAGPHGAGLANLIFCPPSAAVVELHPDHDRAVFARLAIAAGCRHAWAVVNFERPPENLPRLADAIRTFIA